MHAAGQCSFLPVSSLLSNRSDFLFSFKKSGYQSSQRDDSLEAKWSMWSPSGGDTDTDTCAEKVLL